MAPAVVSFIGSIASFAPLFIRPALKKRFGPLGNDAAVLVMPLGSGPCQCSATCGCSRLQVKAPGQRTEVLRAGTEKFNAIHVGARKPKA